MLSRQAVIDFCKDLPGGIEDYPFGEEWTVMRHRQNKKSFALLFERQGVTWVNVKCDPLEAEFLRQVYVSVVPAYHMNKVHWNSILLDGSIPDEEIKAMIRTSYTLTRPKKKRPPKKGTAG